MKISWDTVYNFARFGKYIPGLAAVYLSVISLRYKTTIDSGDATQPRELTEAGRTYLAWLVIFAVVTFGVSILSDVAGQKVTEEAQAAAAAANRHELSRALQEQIAPLTPELENADKGLHELNGALGQTSVKMQKQLESDARASSQTMHDMQQNLITATAASSDALQKKMAAENLAATTQLAAQLEADNQAVIDKAKDLYGRQIQAISESARITEEANLSVEQIQYTLSLPQNFDLPLMVDYQEEARAKRNLDGLKNTCTQGSAGPSVVDGSIQTCGILYRSITATNATHRFAARLFPGDNFVTVITISSDVFLLSIFSDNCDVLHLEKIAEPCSRESKMSPRVTRRNEKVEVNTDVTGAADGGSITLAPVNDPPTRSFLKKAALVWRNIEPQSFEVRVCSVDSLPISSTPAMHQQLFSDDVARARQALPDSFDLTVTAEITSAYRVSAHHYHYVRSQGPTLESPCAKWTYTPQ